MIVRRANVLEMAVRGAKSYLNRPDFHYYPDHISFRNFRSQKLAVIREIARADFLSRQKDLMGPVGAVDSLMLAYDFAKNIPNKNERNGYFDAIQRRLKRVVKSGRLDQSYVPRASYFASIIPILKSA